LSAAIRRRVILCWQPESSAHKLFGQKLIIADPREHEMARRADIYFRPRPGTDLVWVSAMSRYMFDNGHAKQAFLDQCVNGVDEYRKSLEPFTMEYAARTCEVPVETLERVAKEIASAESMCILWAMKHLSKIALPQPTLELRAIFKARCRGPLDQLFLYRSVVQKAGARPVFFIQQRASSKFASMRSSLLQGLRCSAQDPFRIQQHSE
jgi:hypothetical protein